MTYNVMKERILFHLGIDDEQDKRIKSAINISIEELNFEYNKKLPSWDDFSISYLSIPEEILLKVIAIYACIILLQPTETDDVLIDTYQIWLNRLKYKYKITETFSNKIDIPDEFQANVLNFDINHGKPTNKNIYRLGFTKKWE